MSHDCVFKFIVSLSGIAKCIFLCSNTGISYWKQATRRIFSLFIFTYCKTVFLVVVVVFMAIMCLDNCTYGNVSVENINSVSVSSQSNHQCYIYWMLVSCVAACKVSSNTDIAVRWPKSPHRYWKSRAIWDHSVTCHPAEVTVQPLPQPKQVLDLATPEGCKAELTYGWLHTVMVYPPKDGHPSQY